MQQFDIASISILIASISVVVGVILSIVQIRQQTETRQAALFMDIYRQVSSEFVENISRTIALFANYKPGKDLFSSQDRGKILSFLSFSEAVGVLVKRNLIDVDFVADIIQDATIAVWKAMEPWVKGRREREQSAHLWEHTEYLYCKMVSIAK